VGRVSDRLGSAAYKKRQTATKTVWRFL